MITLSLSTIKSPAEIFLINNFFSKKKKKFVLGVSDSKLGGAIADTLDIKCSHIGVVPEIIRGIRFHFAKLVKGKYKVISMFSP